jgi:hypothetical protein
MCDTGRLIRTLDACVHTSEDSDVRSVATMSHYCDATRDIPQEGRFTHRIVVMTYNLKNIANFIFSLITCLKEKTFYNSYQKIFGEEIRFQWGD